MWRVRGVGVGWGGVGGASSVDTPSGGQRLQMGGGGGFRVQFPGWWKASC